jgi:hypothetical protein
MFSLFACVSLCVFAGCNKVPSVATLPVTGSVTRQGQPVEGATVSFMPEDAETGRTAIGVTDAQGRFVAETPLGGQNHAKGAAAGNYIVTVSKLNMVPHAKTMSQAEWQKLSPEEQQKRRGGGMVQKNKPGDTSKENEGKADPTLELPVKYADAKKSDLRASVKAGAQNDFTFDLVD